MPTVKIDAQLSKENLLQAAQQLSPTELEQFAQEVIALKAQQTYPSLSQDETQLLLKINQGLPPATQQRYQYLIEQREAETLTESEYRELLELTEVAEAQQAQRLQDLAQLAQLRQTSLSALVEQLGIQPNSL
ncbi:STAS/SEC14 domain-containing protein [Cronbergia sp. UHCC 0137]|uniref:STAS/SEC14 domain-containing protein n=1 Tax=Cronbergia sp. UHCC 0137 TaxID=3110239 RepID=UPI002B2150C9|nr:STAS/SEC14 domain-containing protein [Cronbergia sp. UHCC 0137]MEA5620578.1 STAS/SEC14 domain-containing protein [Cronbergia sp. UHCC 0137]